MSRMHDTEVEQKKVPEYVPGTEILDSGKRKEFSSGAVRDLEEGKGSFDLLPCRTLQKLARLLGQERFLTKYVLLQSPQSMAATAMDALMDFGQNADIVTFMKATILSLAIFTVDGKVRMSQIKNWRDYFIPIQSPETYLYSYRYLPYEGLRRVAEHFRKGALKYSSRNWEKGIHLSRFRSSAMRHLMQFINGMEDEPHLDAAVWNMICYIETYYKIEGGILSTEFIGDELVLQEMLQEEFIVVPTTAKNIFLTEESTKDFLVSEDIVGNRTTIKIPK